MPLDGRQFSIRIGESLKFLFQVKGDSGSPIELDDYSVEFDFKLGDDDISVGAATIIQGAPDKIEFEITDSESATLARGRYTGNIRLVNDVDTDETIDVLIFAITVFERTEIDLVPLSEASILNILQLDPSFNPLLLKHHIARASSRIKRWLPHDVRTWIKDNGWPQNAIREGEHLAALLLRKDIYDNDDEVQDEIKEQKDIIEHLPVDIDEDGRMERGGNKSLKLVRRTQRDIFIDHGRENVLS